MTTEENGMFAKYRQRLDKIGKQSGFIMPSLSWKNFLFGFFSMPWIWVWSYALLASCYVIYIYLKQDNAYVQFILQQQAAGRMPVYIYWEFSLLACFTNYLLAFLTRKSYPKLETLLFLISLMVLLILVVLLWPYFGLFFK